MAQRVIPHSRDFVPVLAMRSHLAQPTPARMARAKESMEMRRKIPHVSNSAMAAFIKYAQENDLSTHVANKRSLKRDRDMCLEDTPFGPMLITVPLASKSPPRSIGMVMVNPMSFLYTAVNQPGGFSDRFNALWRSNPSTPESPWRLVLYADEVVPGNQLSVVNKRKVWVFYFSFLEFGRQLSDENVWIPLAAEPSYGLKDVSAGISQVTAALLKQFFGARTFDLHKGGILLKRPDGSVFRLFARLDMFLNDGGAHKLIFGCKGDAGSRFCMLCKNLVSRSSSLTDTDGTNLLVCGHVYDSELKFATNSDIRGAIRRVSEYKLTDSSADFKLRSQAIGFSFQPDGLLFDTALLDVVYPSDQYCHDWMHGMCANGVANLVISQALFALERVTRIWTMVQKCVDLWHWPACLRFSDDLFSPERVNSYRKPRQSRCPHLN